MRYLDEYRAAGLARILLEELRRTVRRPWTLMEVCGGQTHSLMKFGIDRVLPAGIELVHGPGCPVCVTPVEVLDQAIELARRPKLVLATFGDMLRVPGSKGNLLQARAEGGDVRIVYSPLDALELARSHPDREVVFLSVGFETTAPATAATVQEADREGISNFSVLVSHVRVPPAIERILAAPGNRIQGFLAAGHVCTVMGVEEYEPISRRFAVPIVITGFEPVDLLDGILRTVRQLESGRAEVEIQYARAVRPEGNRYARAALGEVFEPVDFHWRGLGVIPASGLALRPAYHRFDSLRRFPPAAETPSDHPECRSGEVLAGRLRPSDCPAFGTSCTPDSPLGATMVSAEGACSAYYRYRRPNLVQVPSS